MLLICFLLPLFRITDWNGCVINVYLIVRILLLSTIVPFCLLENTLPLESFPMLQWLSRGSWAILFPWTLVTDLRVPVDPPFLAGSLLLLWRYKSQGAFTHVIEYELCIDESVPQDHLFSSYWLIFDAHWNFIPSLSWPRHSLLNPSLLPLLELLEEGCSNLKVGSSGVNELQGFQQ